MTHTTRGLLGVWSPRSANASDGPLLARVLRTRGLGDDSAARLFLEPSLMHLHDPGLIPDLDKAARRILHAANAGDHIVIYGDYDVDGITATAILFHTLQAVAPQSNVRTYVPHRIDEGYGLNAEAIRTLAAEGAKIIISVDCGITAVAPAQVAREAGVDLIITDHHNPPEHERDLPDAFACVHPRRPGSAYPFPDLCGAGVAFKLAWRLATMAGGGEKVPAHIRELLLDLLALAALGVIADVVPLKGENRVIARFGLSRLKSTKLPGLPELIEASGLSGANVSAEDVGFRLAPRLNACGRMGHAREAVELLTVARGERARAIAEDLSRQNDLRRATEREIFEHACELVQEMGMDRPETRAIVLAHPAWHQGVVGIVCSRLVERFHRPVLLMQDHGEECHGSGRSIDGFSLHAALERCADHLTKFGGHDMAAGLRLPTANLPAFTEAFTSVCNERLAPENLVGTFAYDCEAALAEVTPSVVEQLERLAPFGRENPNVCLRLTGVKVQRRPETFGNGNAHLSLHVTPEGGGGIIRCIAWRRAEWIKSIPQGVSIEALVTPKISSFGGATRVECEIKDLLVR